MNCMKCGKEADKGQVFCAECLQEMEKYPVKPGTAVQIPQRPAEPAAKRVKRRKVLRPEEQIARLRSAVVWMGLTIAVLIAALVLTVAVSLHMMEQQEKAPVIGQNYTSVETTAPTAGEN